MALHMTDAGNQSALPPQQSYYPSANLGTAVSSSMHLTNSSHDSDVGGASGYNKIDQELQYYSVGFGQIKWDSITHELNFHCRKIHLIEFLFRTLRPIWVQCWTIPCCPMMSCCSTWTWIMILMIPVSTCQIFYHLLWINYIRSFPTHSTPSEESRMFFC